MSLDYDLFLGKGFEELDLVKLLLAQPGFQPRGKDFAGPGVLAYVYRAGEVRVELVREALGIEVDLCAGFRVDLGAYDEQKGYLGMPTILRTSLRLLAAGGFDAVLLFNGESPVLLRRSGELVLNSAQGFWSPERLALVDAPHSLEDLPVL